MATYHAAGYQLKLNSVVARWSGVRAGNDVCPFCPGVVEDEVHFVLQCQRYAAVREQFGCLVQAQQRGISAGSLRSLMVPANFDQVSRFLKQAYQLRFVRGMVAGEAQPTAASTGPPLGSSTDGESSDEDEDC